MAISGQNELTAVSNPFPGDQEGDRCRAFRGRYPHLRAASADPLFCLSKGLLDAIDRYLPKDWLSPEERALHRAPCGPCSPDRPRTAVERHVVELIAVDMANAGACAVFRTLLMAGLQPTSATATVAMTFAPSPGPTGDLEVQALDAIAQGLARGQPIENSTRQSSLPPSKFSALR